MTSRAPIPHDADSPIDAASLAARTSPLASWAEYRYGLDLFNHGYYWEAHEAWEAVWLAVGRRGPICDLLKGLIKLAAAGVKARQANAVGLKRHAARAAELFRLVRANSGASDPFGSGLDMLELERFATDLVTAARRLAEGAESATARLPFGLRLISDDACGQSPAH